MVCFRSSPAFLLLLLPICLFVASTLFTFCHGSSQHQYLQLSRVQEAFGRSENGETVPWEARALLAEGSGENSSLILAANRTRRKDPTDNFNYYTGGWNIRNQHYWASVGYTAVPLFLIAIIWFVLFGVCLCLICLCYCCCAREPYGYSRVAYALALILLIFFTIAAIIGCVVLYTGQGKFHASTTSTLAYVVHQAEETAQGLKNVSGYLSAAKKISVDATFLPANVQSEIDTAETKINSSATTLHEKTKENKEDINSLLDAVRLALIVVAAVMLLLAFLGFLFSILGLQCLVYFLVILGWILVTGTFILCGIFLLLHNVAADTCVAMDEWVRNPTAHTTLDDILPCVDNATAQETLNKTKDVTYQLVTVVNMAINNISNVNFPPSFAPLYFNQSGPLVPVLCNPFNADLTDRQCSSGEVVLDNATEVWSSYVCQVSSSGLCTSTGRLSPNEYEQMAAAVNVSYGLYHYGPFLVDLQDCDFVRQTFTVISDDHCPDLRKYSGWIYIGLVMVSGAVMMSLIFWVIYARERRHRVYTKKHQPPGLY